MPRILTVPLGDTQLPVVDITNPAFASLPPDDELTSMTAQYVQESSQNQEVSPQLRAALSQSRLGSGLMAARGTYLTGLNTYLLKIGPDNLPPDFHPIDRRIAASFPAVTTRLRLHDMAVLISDGLIAALALDARRPLHFINIAGGPAADTWNSLLRLRRGDSSLERREISVRVLDLDEEGPAFGARAFDALQTADAPLAGFHIRFTHQSYNWAAFHDLKRILDSTDLKRSACAVSSEGGLFEYGSDHEIIGNLTALLELTPDDAIVVGSACRESDLTRIHAGIGVTLRPRPRQAFGALVERAGWRVDTFIERPFNDSVRLVKVGGTA
jgi:hypothetical protein